MATEAQSSLADNLTREAPPNAESLFSSDIPKPTWSSPPVLVTTYTFPNMEPVRFAKYPRNYLYMPLRKDLLHRAVVYEGDNTRAGTASTKWRDEVRGSGRKLYQQKGSGRARAGDKKSPVRVGGGVAHGPHPRDFSTDLPKKIYDKAWRIALSYRYRRGELIVIQNSIGIPQGATPYLIKEILERNEWRGSSTMITGEYKGNLFDAVREAQGKVKILQASDVDVKDLLETRRLIVEKPALDSILKRHKKDLISEPAVAWY